jgi:hypothetical protein
LSNEVFLIGAFLYVGDSRIPLLVGNIEFDLAVCHHETYLLFLSFLLVTDLISQLFDLVYLGSTKDKLLRQLKILLDFKLFLDELAEARKLTQFCLSLELAKEELKSDVIVHTLCVYDPVVMIVDMISNML